MAYYVAQKVLSLLILCLMIEEPIYEYTPGKGWVAHDRLILGQLIKEHEGKRFVLTNRMPRPGERFWSDGFDLEYSMRTITYKEAGVGAEWDRYTNRFPKVEDKDEYGMLYKLVVIEIYDIETGRRLQ